MTTILVVDDEPNIREVVGLYLRREGHTVVEASDGEEALRLARQHPPDLVVLDLMLPKLSGLEVCRRLQSERRTPVIMLTAKSEENDRIIGLGVGADDYIVKPFSPRELALRVRSVLRRSEVQTALGVEPVVADGDLRLDTDARSVSLAGREISLTTREFDLLAYLMAHPGRALRREDLMRDVWGWEFGDQSTVTVHVRRVREKIEADPAEPRRLVTVWGVGYRWDPAPDSRGDALARTYGESGQ